LSGHHRAVDSGAAEEGGVSVWGGAGAAGDVDAVFGRALFERWAGVVGELLWGDVEQGADWFLRGGGVFGVEADEADSAAGGAAGVSGDGRGREAVGPGGGGSGGEGISGDDHGESSGGAGALRAVGAVEVHGH